VNKNLIGDEDQELETHLRKRHASARRLSSVALATQIQQQHLLRQHLEPKLSQDSTNSNGLTSSMAQGPRRESSK